MTDKLLTEADIDNEAWMGGQRDKVRELLRRYAASEQRIELLRKTLAPRLVTILNVALAEGIRADIRVDEMVAENAQECLRLLNLTPEETLDAKDSSDEGPGTPIARLSYLLDELELRFPGVVNPVMSDPPEPKLFRALDAVLAKNVELKTVLAECLNDLRSPFPAESRVIAQLGMGSSSIEKAEKALAT